MEKSLILFGIKPSRKYKKSQIFLVFMINKILRAVCWKIIDIHHFIWLRFDMWLKDYEYSSWLEGYRRYYGIK